MKPEIKTMERKLLIGKSIEMSMVENKTFELWNSFMTNRKLIENEIGNDLYSIQVYDGLLDMKNFNPHLKFTKWAATEVSDIEKIPEVFSSFILEKGLYAVFNYKGLPQDFPKMLGYIFGQWLPASDYVIDERPHFEVLGEKYKRNDPDSEEEVWIPIKIRQ